jgi:hypothetical protein
VSSETATYLSDIVLAAGTFFLGMTVGPRKNARTWTALFVMLALSAGFGAIYHGTLRFHSPEFWVLVSTTAVASAFLFLAASLTIAQPHWKWLGWLWPMLGLGGFLLGGLLSHFPFYYISIVSGICLILSVFALIGSPLTQARNWLFLGIAVTIAALVCQKFANNAAFHFLQLAANMCFWMGARRT